jgi:hypothetical protein
VKSRVRSDTGLFRALARTLLKQGIAVRFRAHGRSMFPAIADGDTVEVFPGNARTGDVVLIDSARGPVAHRVVSWRKNEILTRGDSCDDNDDLHSRSAVLGKVVRVITPQGEHRAPDTLRRRLRNLVKLFR